MGMGQKTKPPGYGPQVLVPIFPLTDRATHFGVSLIIFDNHSQMGDILLFGFNSETSSSTKKGFRVFPTKWGTFPTFSSTSAQNKWASLCSPTCFFFFFLGATCPMVLTNLGLANWRRLGPSWEKRLQSSSQARAPGQQPTEMQYLTLGAKSAKTDELLVV